MQQTIKQYIDHCLGFVQENREYLMFVPFYDDPIQPEMQDSIDATALEGKSAKIYVTQPEHTDYLVNIVTEKEHIWKAIDNQITDSDISEVEKQLNITLPASYKIYLKYKHYYEIFWDLDVFLFPKPIHT